MSQPNSKGSIVKTRRRPRAIQACSFCRIKKYKCNGGLPCSSCRKHRTECTYNGAQYRISDSEEYSVGYVKELERRLEAALQALQQTKSSAFPILHQEDGSSSSITKLPNSVDRDISHKDQASLTVQDSISTDPNYSSADTIEIDEVMDINTACCRFEFHGRTSYLAVIERLQKILEFRTSGINAYVRYGPMQERKSVVNELQHESNPFDNDFPSSSKTQLVDYHPHHAILFIDSYFKGIYFINPMLDQEIFAQKCHDLWAGRSDTILSRFKSLYFSVLALGCLTRTWTETSINGMGRLEWTKMLFQQAETALHEIESRSNLEGVQSQIILAQVCQQQLNSNLAYTYLGMAIRSALSAGINRKVMFRDPQFPQDSPTEVVARTWWSLYCLEVEVSFSLGRPDTLGSDIYHNRPLPSATGSPVQMIPSLYSLSNIIQEISAAAYTGPASIEDKLQRSALLEIKLDVWFDSLPEQIKPMRDSSSSEMLSLKEDYWAKLQMLNLKIRFLHVKTTLFFNFFLQYDQKDTGTKTRADILTASQKCIASAQSTINTVHSAYLRGHMRNWWYNTVYVTLSLSILLIHLSRQPPMSAQDGGNRDYVQKAFQILEVMGESVIARKIRELTTKMYSSLDDGHKFETSLQQISGIREPILPDLPSSLPGYLLGIHNDPSAFNLFTGEFGTI